MHGERGGKEAESETGSRFHGTKGNICRGGSWCLGARECHGVGSSMTAAALAAQLRVGVHLCAPPFVWCQCAGAEREGAFFLVEKDFVQVVQAALLH